VNKEELERRTKGFALRLVRFVAALPKNKVSDVLGYQLLKAATSIGANYREAHRAVSRNFGFLIANFGLGAPRRGSCHQCLEGEFEILSRYPDLSSFSKSPFRIPKWSFRNPKSAFRNPARVTVAELMRRGIEGSGKRLNGTDVPGPGTLPKVWLEKGR
jgi:hypothetical protein